MRIRVMTKAALAGISVAAATAAMLPAALAGAATSSAKAAASLPVITIAMNGKTITVGGTLQSGGVEVVSTVTREAQGDPVFVLLDPGVTVAQFEAALPAIGADPNNIDGIGSIVFSPQANKGTSSAQVDLAAGQYVALDISSSGLPPLTTFVISPATSPASLPTPKATVSSIEFAFRGPGVLRDGELVRFQNRGFLVHMIISIRAKSLADARKLAALLHAGKVSKAMKLATASYSFDNALTHNAYQQEVIHNKPGFWVLACFMNTQDGREHTQLGMERVIHIVK